MKITLRSLRLLLITAITILLAACDGVGQGNRIVSVKVVSGDTLAAITEPLVVYQCLRQSVHMLATFTDGEVGDYTTRVKWTSTNDSVVHVSNADGSIPGDHVPSQTTAGLVYAAGTLIPGATTGTATITATYVGLSASTTVEVKAPTSLYITKDTEKTAVLPNLTIAPSSTQSLHVLAKLAGGANEPPTDVTNFALWSIPDDLSGAIATVSTAGVLTGVAAGNATVKASFDSCPNATALTTPLTVAPIDHVALTAEQDDTTRPTPFTSTPGSLYAGTYEALTLKGYFAPGNAEPSQDLTYQTATKYYADSATSCPTSDTQSPSTDMGFLLLSGFQNIILAGTPMNPVPVQLSASFYPNPPDSSATIPAANCAIGPQLTVNTTGVLTGITVSPATPAPLSGATQQFYATGSFADAHGNSIGTQDVTRRTFWSVADTTLASITNFVLFTSSTGGYLGTSFSGSGCTNVTATTTINNVTPPAVTVPLTIGTGACP